MFYPTTELVRLLKNLVLEHTSEHISSNTIQYLVKYLRTQTNGIIFDSNILNKTVTYTKSQPYERRRVICGIRV